MKTPMQELFHRVEQLRFAKNPIDELMKIEIQMLEKEKEVMVDFAYKFGDEPLSEIPEWYDKQFNTKEK